MRPGCVILNLPPLSCGCFSLSQLTPPPPPKHALSITPPDCPRACVDSQSGATRASQRLLRHWSVIAIYDDDWSAGRGALLDPVTGHPDFPPLEAPAMLLQGIAHRLLLATSEAVSHVHSDGLARELATATVSAATSLLRTEAAMRALGPGPDAGSVDLGVLSPEGAWFAGTNGQADAAPPPQANPTGSGTSSRDGSTAPQPPPSLLTFKRLERILLRVRSVLVKQTQAVQDDIIILSMLRKHVSPPAPLSVNSDQSHISCLEISSPCR